MKKLFSVIAWTLALNFLAAAGGIAWLYKSGRLTRDKLHQIREMVFAPATQPVEAKPEVRDPATQPTVRLEQLLAQVSGRSAGEQLAFIQQNVSSQMAMLDRRFADLQDQRRTIDQAKSQLDKDREKLKADQEKLATAQQAQQKLESDQGFQDTLERYNAMPPKQLKTIFMAMPDPTMLQYLRAMEPRMVAKIFKEFKSPEEMQRVSKVMEKMRQPEASVKDQQ